MKKLKNRHLIRLLGFTVIMLAIILTATLVATQKIKTVAQEQCFEELQDETRAMGKEIEQKVEANRQQLELIAQVAQDYDDLTSEELWQKLESYITSGLMSRVEILLPDDTVITSSGRIIDVSGKLSFEEQAALGEHISDREEDVTGNGGYVVYHYVPIKHGNETVAMLYGVAVLSEMPEKIIDQPYGGEAAMYLIDRTTGDFLMDSWHDELGNMWDFSGRQMAKGYNDEALQSGVANGESNYVVFVSKTIGSYLYFYYTPIGVNKWCVALSVPENVVLAQAQSTGRILNAFLAVEGACLLLCLGAMIRYVRIETRDKQRQLDRLNRIYEVEQLLFNAHENSDKVSAALEQVADMLDAQLAAYWMMTQPGYEITFAWSKPESSVEQSNFATQCKNAHALMQYFINGGQESLSVSGAELENYIAGAAERGMDNALAVPVRDMQSGICGVLLVVNRQEADGDAALLRSLGASFGMFCHNMRTYHSVKEQGETDILTGIYNRNRYEMDAANYRDWYKKSLACMYADANGLHEINNTQGHAAGDKMLQTVASCMIKYFGEEHCYRIGGDEFVAFAVDENEVMVRRQAVQFAADVRQAGYNVAVGVDFAHTGDDFDTIVEGAEQKMYAAKNAYYAAHTQRTMRA